MKLFLLYVDAWPFRYRDILVDALAGADSDFSVSRLIPVYGYTDCFKTTLLSGLYPRDHGYWVSYRFSEDSVRRPLPGFLSWFLDRSDLVARGSRFILNRFLGNHLIHVRSWGHIRGNGFDPEAAIVEIDGVLRSRGLGTLFSFMEERNIEYAVLEDRFYAHSLDRFSKAILSVGKDVDVVFAYIDEPDFWGHRYGVEDARYLALIRWLARVLRHLLRVVSSLGASYLVFSDHGMATVRRFLNVYDLFWADPLYGREYVVGIDATFLRIFYLRGEPVKSPVLERVRRIVGMFGYRLSGEDFDKYGLPSSRYYGDEVYALREGVVFFPNFFSWLKPYGMHAYSPDYPNQHGVVVASSDIGIDRDVIDVVGLSRVIRRVIGAL